MYCCVQFANKDELYGVLVNCDVIIYDITEHADQIEEATWVASRMLQSFIREHDCSYCKFANIFESTIPSVSSPLLIRQPLRFI